MFAGHVGAALAIGRVERRVNIGIFVAAAILLDIALWLFVLLGWESVSIPANFAETHQADFEFPYSHGLVASVAWSVIAGAAAFGCYARQPAIRWRAATLIAVAVFSHWLLDAVVHHPELPLAGADSPNVGLNLWSNMPVALATEAAIVILGLWLFACGSSLPLRRLLALILLTLFVLAFTVAGMTIAPAPPSSLAMAGSSLITLVAVCGLFCWLGRRVPKRA